jgi:hypothetical protein
MTDVTTSFHILPVSYEFLQLLIGGHVAQAVNNETLTGVEADLWWTHLAEANARGTFLYGFTAFVVCGAKPC